MSPLKGEVTTKVSKLLTAANLEFVEQALVPGPESQICFSYLDFSLRLFLTSEAETQILKFCCFIHAELQKSANREREREGAAIWFVNQEIMTATNSSQHYISLTACMRGT